MYESLPPWARVLADAALAVTQIGAFFGLLWFTWFCVWVFS